MDEFEKVINDKSASISRLMGLFNYDNQTKAELYCNNELVAIHVNFMQSIAIRVGVKNGILKGDYHFKYGDEIMAIDQDGRCENWPVGLWEEYDELLMHLI